jgi:hypothetical protein
LWRGWGRRRGRGRRGRGGRGRGRWRAPLAQELPEQHLDAEDRLAEAGRDLGGWLVGPHEVHGGGEDAQGLRCAQGFPELVHDIAGHLSHAEALQVLVQHAGKPNW